MRVEDCLVLQRTGGPSPGLSPGAGPLSRTNLGPFIPVFDMTNTHLSRLTMYLENCYGKPVLDQTGLTNYYDIRLDPASVPKDDAGDMQKALATALGDQLGMELVPSHEPVEMLVIRRVK
jgi:uncharacterized protein (TIGR03435 family)